MPNTPIFGWPFQALLDSPDGASLGEDLALAVEATVNTVNNNANAAQADVNALEVVVNRIISASTATVATSQTTGSTSYVDLATSGPAVTLTTGTKALVLLKTGFFNSSSFQTFMSFAVSGATTLAAADARSISIQNNSLFSWGAAFLLTALTAGSNTFTAKYRVVGGTGTWVDRDIIVIPLN